MSFQTNWRVYTFPSVSLALNRRVATLTTGCRVSLPRTIHSASVSVCGTKLRLATDRAVFQVSSTLDMDVTLSIEHAVHRFDQPVEQLVLVPDSDLVTVETHAQWCQTVNFRTGAVVAFHHQRMPSLVSARGIYQYQENLLSYRGFNARMLCHRNWCVPAHLTSMDVDAQRSLIACTTHMGEVRLLSLGSGQLRALRCDVFVHLVRFVPGEPHLLQCYCGDDQMFTLHVGVRHVTVHRTVSACVGLPTAFVVKGVVYRQGHHLQYVEHALDEPECVLSSTTHSLTKHLPHDLCRLTVNYLAGRLVFHVGETNGV